MNTTECNVVLSVTRRKSRITKILSRYLGDSFIVLDSVLVFKFCIKNDESLKKIDVSYNVAMRMVMNGDGIPITSEGATPRAF